MNDIMQSMYRSSPSVLARIVIDYHLEDELYRLYSERFNDVGQTYRSLEARALFDAYRDGTLDSNGAHRGIMSDLLVLLIHNLLQQEDVGSIEQWDILSRLKEDKDLRMILLQYK